MFESEIIHFKILVPRLAAGAIIGRGGGTRANLQNENNARIEISAYHDYYPGTSEQVCLISGSKGSIMEVLDFISFKIREKPDMSNEQYEERVRQVKILVPNSTARRIIGKGGRNIKQLWKQSGAFVQVSQKADDQPLKERCITVTGDDASNKKACIMILSKVQEDPLSGSIPNVSYADITGPVPNSNPTGSPYAPSPTSPQIFPPNPTVPQIPWSGPIESPGLGGFTLTLNLEPSNPPAHTFISQVVSAINERLGSAGKADHVKTEISSAIAILEKYRMLGLAWTGASSSPNLLAQSSLEGATHNDFFDPGGGAAACPVLDFALDPFLLTPTEPNTPPHPEDQTFGLSACPVRDFALDSFLLTPPEPNTPPHPEDQAFGLSACPVRDFALDSFLLTPPEPNTPPHPEDQAFGSPACSVRDFALDPFLLTPTEPNTPPHPEDLAFGLPDYN